MRTVRLVVISLFIIAITKTTSAHSDESTSSFRFFDGIWQITEGPFSGVKMQLGKGPTPNLKFAMMDETTALPVLEGTAVKIKKDQIKGTFGPGDLSPETINTPFGLGISPSGTFSFKLDSETVSRLSGTVTSNDGIVVPVVAELLLPTFRVAKFTTAIKPKIIKSYKVGKTVSFSASALLNGPSGVDKNQLALRITLDQSIEDITISNIKNLEPCNIIDATTSTPPYIICGIDILGIKAKVAALKFKVRVPFPLSGSKLTATIDLIAVGNTATPSELTLNLIAKSKTTKIKILGKKYVPPEDVCAMLIGTWAFPNGSTLTYASDLSVVLTAQDSSQTVGTWLCEDHPNLHSFVISNFFPNNQTDFLTLTPSGDSLDWLITGQSSVISGSKL